MSGPRQEQPGVDASRFARPSGSHDVTASREHQAAQTLRLRVSAGDMAGAHALVGELDADPDIDLGSVLRHLLPHLAPRPAA